MFKTRAVAAALALVLAGLAAAPASAEVGACRQQGFRTLVNGVWHHYVWVKQNYHGHTMYSLMDCGPAF